MKGCFIVNGGKKAVKIPTAYRAPLGQSRIPRRDKGETAVFLRGRQGKRQQAYFAGSVRLHGMGRIYIVTMVSPYMVT